MIKTPRVCIIRQYYFPQEVHLRRDIKALIEGGFEVDVICARERDEKLFENWNGVNIYRIPVCHLRRGILRYLYEYLYFFIRATLLLTRLFFKKNYDCIEVDTMPDFLVFCAIVPKLFKARVILYLFENMPILFSDKYKLLTNHPLIKVLQLIEFLCVKFADQTIITHHREEIFHKKSILLPNVPDEEMLIIDSIKNNTNRYLQANIYDTRETVKVITHSTLTEIYGVQNIIKAIAVLKEKYSKIRCEIIGTGEYQETLLKLVASLSLEDYIQFTGFIPFEELAEHLKTADIGVVSILGNYLLPNKLFEYIALEIPVVCSATKSIKLFFYDNEILYYDPNDYQQLASQIEWMMFHYDVALSMARKACARYRNEYQWLKVKNLYVNSHYPLRSI